LNKNDEGNKELTNLEVIQRLRELKQPKTLFGENDLMRLKRLKLFELEFNTDNLSNDINENGCFKENEITNEYQEKDENEGDDNDLIDKEDNLPYFSKKRDWKVTAKPEELILSIEGKRCINTDKLPYEYKSDEVFNWCQMTFNEWQKEIEEMDSEARRKAEGKQKIALYRQCKRYVKPLLLLLKKQVADKDIVDKLFESVVFAMEGDYVRAHDKYIELAIGNAPWPMGVTMVGIHERTGRSKIFTSQVAHILNDETQKRYLQSFKRLISVYQRRHPTTPSKSVFS